MNYSESLKEHRLSRGLSLLNIEKATGISNENLSRWENGKTIPGINFCIQLAQFYGISLDELVGFSEIPDMNTNTPKPISQKTQQKTSFIENFNELFSDANYINISKLFKGIKPELRAYTLGYVIGLLQAQGVDTQKLLKY